jgi:hypothetical protein
MKRSGASLRLGIATVAFLSWRGIDALLEVQPANLADRCELEGNIRPVVSTAGLFGSMLFNYSDGYSTAYPSSIDSFRGLVQDQALPLQWDINGTQKTSHLGPKSSPTDDHPGASGPHRAFFAAVCPVVLLWCGLMQ